MAQAANPALDHTGNPPKTLHLAGTGVKHSIAPPMHDFIAKSLGLPWTFYSTECAKIDDVVALSRLPSTAGLVVTMPYKQAIMEHLDETDPLASTIGACNNVYRDKDHPTRLRGTNTDWLGIKGCLLEKSKMPPDVSSTGLIIGAGGASRAAVYALSAHLGCDTIYILNRDKGEVDDLIHDSQRLESVPDIVHITNTEQAGSLKMPYYIVGTIPDFEPSTASEILVRTCLETFLSRTDKGVLLDMCFKPRRTRILKLAEKHDWATVEGTHVIGYQIEEQWRLWAGEETVRALDRKGAWEVLLKTAEESPAINF